jgi:hypothetical protein
MGLVRWSVLFFFLIFGLPGLIAGAISGIGADRPELFITLVGLILAALLGLVLSLLILPRQRLPLALEFVVMLALVGGLYILGLYAAVGATRLSGINLVSGYLVPDAVTESRTLIIPLLILAGAETINFGVSLSGWGTQSARRFAPEWVVLALLITLLASRWISFVVYDVLPGVTDDQLEQWAGALLAGIVLIPVALWRARKPFPDRVPLKLVLGLIVSMVLPQFLLFVVRHRKRIFLSTSGQLDRSCGLEPARGCINFME